VVAHLNQTWGGLLDYIYMENPQCQVCVCEANSIYDSCTMDLDWDVLSEPGAPGGSYMDMIESNWSAAVTTDPNLSPLFGFIVDGGIVGSAFGNGVLKVDLIYDVIFYAPSVPSSS